VLFPQANASEIGSVCAALLMGMAECQLLM